MQPLNSQCFSSLSAAIKNSNMLIFVPLVTHPTESNGECGISFLGTVNTGTSYFQHVKYSAFSLNRSLKSWNK